VARVLKETPLRRYVELITERPVERFLVRLFLRASQLNGLFIVSPYLATLSDSPYSLEKLRKKVESNRIPTYIVTRDPVASYQLEAMEALAGSPWIEVRYNSCVHAKVYVAAAERDADSFALFGSGNLTFRSIYSNVERAMMVYSQGPGREIWRDLHYWASVRLRTLKESRLIQPIRARRR